MSIIASAGGTVENACWRMVASSASRSNTFWDGR
jgi:hypothetical protein